VTLFAITEGIPQLFAQGPEIKEMDTVIPDHNIVTVMCCRVTKKIAPPVPEENFC
jgi:hypothetical protein